MTRLLKQSFRLTSRFCPFVALILSLAAPCAAELTLHSLFTDHGVLQQNQPIPIWGTADPQGKIEVTFGDQKKATAANHDGHWMVKLDPITASARTGSTGRNQWWRVA